MRNDKNLKIAKRVYKNVLAFVFLQNMVIFSIPTPSLVHEREFVSTSSSTLTETEIGFFQLSCGETFDHTLRLTYMESIFNWLFSVNFESADKTLMFLRKSFQVNRKLIIFFRKTRKLLLKDIFRCPRKQNGNLP